MFKLLPTLSANPLLFAISMTLSVEPVCCDTLTVTLTLSPSSVTVTSSTVIPLPSCATTAALTASTSTVLSRRPPYAIKLAGEVGGADGARTVDKNSNVTLSTRSAPGGSGAGGEEGGMVVKRTGQSG